MSYAISPIDALLCDLLGRASDEVVASHLAQLTDADWTQLYESSNFHSVTPQIYRRAKDFKSIPPERMEPFKRAYFLNARANAIYFHEFTRLFTALHQADLPVIVLKGAYLAEHVYRNIAARTIGDVDLVFKFPDLERALALIEELGYANRSFSLDSEQQLSQELAYPHTRPNSADLDIHWGLEATSSGFNIDTEGLWQRSTQVKLAGVEVRALCPEDLLLHQCLHCAFHHHFQGGLRGLADIREVILHPPQPIDWHTFSLRAHEWRVTRPMYFALRFTQELTGVPLPDGLLSDLFKDELPEELYEAALRNLFEAEVTETVMTADLARMLTAKSLWQRIRIWLQAALPSRGLLARRYLVDVHSPFIWFYYPVRIFDLLRLYGLSVLKAAGKHQNALQATETMQTGNQLRDWMSDKLDNS